jgi:LPXTG-motif cell wall-anchored protein
MKGETIMDTTTVIRIVAGILFAAVLVFLIKRRRKNVT